MTTAVAKKQSDEAGIKWLQGLEPVRTRPAMYIGDVDRRGLHHLVWEIVDNSVDEYLNGYADTITVTLHKDGHSVTVEDNGRGIPVGMHPKYKRPTLELILTTLHTGGKFDEDAGYKWTGGLHGVGSSAVTALSKKLTATIRREGHEWQQTFARGKPTGEIKQVRPFRGHGTIISFEPDPDIFRNTQFDADVIWDHLEGISYVHKGLTIHFGDEVNDRKKTFAHPGGLPEFLAKLVKQRGKEEDETNAEDTVTEGAEGERSEEEAEDGGAVVTGAFTLARKDATQWMELAMQWTESPKDEVRSYVNGIRTAGGGTHETGLKSGIAKAVRNWMVTHEDRVKMKTSEITSDDIREGVVAVLSVFVREPMFQGQTKDRLNNPEMAGIVENWVRSGLEAWLNTNMTEADKIVGRIVMAARARMASRAAAVEVKRSSGVGRRTNLPIKLADCQSKHPHERELFIVEGNSAGGSAKQGRDVKTQAVLPLRGKVLNSEGLPLSKVLTNAELSDLVSAIGTGAGDKFDIGELRYNKIILLMDADEDGMHISTLLLAFFFRHLPELIKKGHVYIAQPPLFRIDVGKETHWARDGEHKDQIIAGLRANAKYEVSRFKGLGEMDAKVLKETTLDKRTRTLLRVKIDSLLDTDKTFVDLLGKDAAERQRKVMSASITEKERG